MGYRLTNTLGELTPLQIEFLKWGYEKLLAARKSEDQIPATTPKSAVARYHEKRKMYDYVS